MIHVQAMRWGDVLIGSVGGCLMGRFDGEDQPSCIMHHGGTSAAASTTTLAYMYRESDRDTDLPDKTMGSAPPRPGRHPTQDISVHPPDYLIPFSSGKHQGHTAIKILNGTALLALRIHHSTKMRP